MEVLGRVKVINPVQQVSASFKKREVVVTTDEQYPQHISIEFQQDKTDLLNSYAVGEPVKVSINLRGREWVSPQGEVKQQLLPNQECLHMAHHCKRRPALWAAKLSCATQFSEPCQL
ncbi:MAG: DUF3127 domain-containing protein, partial [Flavobacterium sp.]